MKQAITVSQLVHYLKGVIEDNAYTQNILVEGELSNFTNHRSGHWYFSLKDENAVINCAMFASYNQKVNFVPKEGDKVIVRGNVSVFEARGSMQLLVNKMENNQLGELYLKYEALKKKLLAEGLFLEEHKKQIPSYPMSIGLVTGDQTAARADVLKTLQRRWPIAKVIDYTVNVQGKESAGQIIEALKKADEAKHDVLLLVRGGGSIEDLWSFNDENLAYTIYQLKTPIITGIGHEINETIADYVADLRAPTPTAAAELASPNMIEVYASIKKTKERLSMLMMQNLMVAKKEFTTLKNNRVFTNPERLYSERQMKLHFYENTLRSYIEQRELQAKHTIETSRQLLLHHISKQIQTYRYDLKTIDTTISNQIQQALQKKQTKLAQSMALLDAYSPLKVMQRGYAVTLKDGKTIKSVFELKPQDKLQIRYIDGIVTSTVEEIEEKNHE